MSRVELKGVKKRFGSDAVIHGIDMSIDDGELVVFVGPSGCGKSTLLRLIAGLEDVSEGEILLDGRVVNAESPKERGIAMVFQNYALYPHMTVYDNLAFNLKVDSKSRQEIQKRVTATAQLLHIEPLLERRPKTLSGGQRQRVAIGRAIVREPRLFLFDEPLSNLDAELRVKMRSEIAKLHQELGSTMIYVTHDQTEAMTLADRIVVLDAGIVQQIGTPMELYHHPSNQFVAGFIGSPKMNMFALPQGAGEAADNSVFSRVMKSISSDAAGGGALSNIAQIGVRPEHFSLETGQDVEISGTARVVERLGGQTGIELDAVDGTPFFVMLNGDHVVRLGDRIAVGVSKDNIHTFDQEGANLTAV